MDKLPPEIRKYIFSFLNAEILIRVLPMVGDWGLVARLVVEERLLKMTEYFAAHPEYFQDVLRMLPPGFRGDQELLPLFEKLFLSKGFTIKKNRMRGGQDFFGKVKKLKECSCLQKNLCVIRSIHFMECYQLILVQLPEKILFYSMDCLKDGVDCHSKEYSTSLLVATNKGNIYIDNNKHTAVSVYNDKVVSQETTRVLMLFRVAEVDHVLKTVILYPIRRIYLPLWSCDLILLKDRVCTLFTTGSVGVWNMQDNDIQVSTNTCVDNATMRAVHLTKMYRCNNLVLVKIMTDSTVRWSVFDAKTTNEEFQLFHIQLDDLITNCFLESGSVCSKVFDFFVNINSLMIHCQVTTQAVENRRAGVTWKILLRRISEDNLSVHCFQTADAFSAIFEDDSGSTQFIQTDSTELFTCPFLYPKELRFIGLNEYRSRRNNHPSSLEFNSFQSSMYFLAN